MTAVAVDLLQASSLFVSPHYDDVPLSCGGVVAALAERGWAPRMVTVFASELVDAMVGEFAAWKHARWRLEEPDSVLSTRRAEDAEAAKTLGCEARWLGLPDAIYRGDRYTSDQELFGRLHAEEEELGEVLADELTQLPEWRDGDRVFVPLGIGSHVDHQLAFEAGRRLARRGVEVFAYEDCPYAIHTPEGVGRRLDAVRDHVGEPVLIPIGAAIERRLDAIACYRSQIPVIFRFTDDFRRAVRAFALDRGGLRGPVERFWPVLG